MNLKPTSELERVAALDELRGFALYGVFLTNAYVSSRSFIEAFSPPDIDSGFWEVFAWFVFEGLLVEKFVTLFSLLFGMGLILQYQRAKAKNIPFIGIYLRRLGLLAIMGIVHGCLLFSGDILFVYACFGFLLFLFRNRTAKSLLKLALIPLIIGIILSLIWVMLGFNDLKSKPDEFEVWAEEVRRSGGILEVLAVRSWEYLYWLVVSSISSFNWRVMALFFIGAAIMKKGWIDPKYSKLHRIVALIGLTIGGGIEFSTAAITLFSSDLPIVAQLVLSVVNELGSLVLSAGYFGAVLWLSHSGYLTFLRRSLAAVGRSALSNYIFQSLIMNVIFLPFGLGLYENLSRAETLVWISVIFVIQICISCVWMRIFQQGPLEWVWKRLTYMS